MAVTEAPPVLNSLKNDSNQTRGVVWGAERSELVITETLAFHDRRTEDLESNDQNGHDVMKGTSNNALRR